MPYIINTKPLFYDYFPHLPTRRMKEDFGLGYFEQAIVRDEIQGVITMAYDQLVDQHDLRHYDVYGEVGEQFDDNFYRELKEAVSLKLLEMDTWIFLDGLMPKKEIEDEQENADFLTKIGAIKPRDRIGALIAVGGSTRSWQSMALECMQASTFSNSFKIIDMYMATMVPAPAQVLLHEEKLARAREILHSELH